MNKVSSRLTYPPNVSTSTRTGFLRFSRRCLCAGLLVPCSSLAMEATIDQTGNDSSAIIEQINNTANVSAEIVQSGESQDAYIIQEGGRYGDLDARVMQIEMNNQAIVEQRTVAGGLADVQQRGADNRVLIQQQIGFGMEGREMQALVFQEGDANRVTLSQNLDGQAIATVSQIGNGNIADLVQGTGSADYDSNAEIHLSVTGDNNSVSVFQNLSWTHGYIEVDYSGNNNIADIHQSGETPALILTSVNSSHNMDTLYQATADTQLIQVNRINTEHSSINIYQSGYFYSASVTQASAIESGAEILQLNDLALRGSATINQEDVNLATAYIEQEMTGNAVVEQQNVNDSEARISQYTVYDTYAYIRQSNGELNYAEIRQEISMSCCDYSASIEQSGTSNYASILQSAGVDSVYGITPTAAITQSGTNNHAAITQM